MDTSEYVSEIRGKFSYVVLEKVGEDYLGFRVRNEALYSDKEERNVVNTIKRRKFNCCFTVHFDKYKTILPTNAPFIKT